MKQARASSALHAAMEALAMLTRSVEDGHVHGELVAHCAKLSAGVDAFPCAWLGKHGAVGQCVECHATTCLGCRQQLEPRDEHKTAVVHCRDCDPWCEAKWGLR